MLDEKAVELSTKFLENYSEDKLVMDDFSDVQICENYTEAELSKHKIALQERYEIGVKLKDTISQCSKSVSERITFSLKKIDEINVELSGILLSSASSNFFIKMEDMDIQFFGLAHNIIVEFKGIGKFVELLQNLNIISPLGVSHKDVKQESIWA